MPAVTGWWEEVTVNARPGPAALRVIGGNPAVIVGGGSLRPTPAALTITGSAPTIGVTQHRRVTPAPALLTVIGSHPALGVTLRPAAAIVSIVGGTPVVRASDHKRLTPTGATLEIAGGTPAVRVSDRKIIRPSAAALIVTGAAPALTAAVTVAPGPAVLILVGGLPTILAPMGVRPGPAVLEIAGSRPTLGGEITIRPSGAGLSVAGGTPTVGLSASSSSGAVITLGSLVTGSPYGRVNVDGIQGATVIAGLCGYYASYNKKTLRCGGTALPLASQENAGSTSLTDLKIFQGQVNSASGTWLIDAASGTDSSYNADGAVVVSGHSSITPRTAVVLPTGTTSYTVTPPTGGYSVVFIALQWGSNPDTTVSASGVTVVNDLRSTYSSLHACVISAPTTLNISPAVLSGRSAGLLKQIDIV